MPGTPQCYTAQGGQEEPAAEPRKLPARKGETRRGRSPMCFKRGGGCRLWRRCSGTQSWGLATGYEKLGGLAAGASFSMSSVVTEAEKWAVTEQVWGQESLFLNKRKLLCVCMPMGRLRREGETDAVGGRGQMWSHARGAAWCTATGRQEEVAEGAGGSAFCFVSSWTWEAGIRSARGWVRECERLDGELQWVDLQ